MSLRVGDWVEVRRKDEILATLDENGELDKLPFMPQLFQYCGQRFQVHKRAGKTCSEISGGKGVTYIPRRLRDTVHLQHRCDGLGYGGCQVGCLIFWKEAWLKPVIANAPGGHPSDETFSARASAHQSSSRCTEERVYEAATRRGQEGDVRYSCQATALLDATTPLKWWDARQYVEAYRSGNNSLGTVLKSVVYLLYYYGTFARFPRLGVPSRWLYDRFQMLWGGLPFPRKSGKIAAGKTTPRLDLNLKPGEWVRVKSYEQILETVDASAFNRGLSFDAELVPYCGNEYRVRNRVERFIDEKTGKMMKMKTPAVILENVYCQSLYSGKRALCPRGVFLWWREIWLERVCENQVEVKEPQSGRVIPTNLLKASASSNVIELVGMPESNESCALTPTQDSLFERSRRCWPHGSNRLPLFPLSRRPRALGGGRPRSQQRAEASADKDHSIILHSTGGCSVLDDLYWDGQGFCLFAKRLEKGRFTWPGHTGGGCDAFAGAMRLRCLDREAA